MTAPEVTPAVRRAAEALATDQEHIPWAGHRHPDNWEDHARAAVTAALDTGCHEAVVPEWADGEEMPCEAHVVGYRLDEEQHPYPVCAEHMRSPMTTIRTALLGPDVVWQGDGVRAVASNLVAVDEGDI